MAGVEEGVLQMSAYKRGACSNKSSAKMAAFMIILFLFIFKLASLTSFLRQKL